MDGCFVGCDLILDRYIGYRPLSAFKVYEINDVLKTSGRYTTVSTNHNRNTELIKH